MTRYTWHVADEPAAVRGELARVDSKCSTLADLAGAAAAFTAPPPGMPRWLRVPRSPRPVSPSPLRFWCSCSRCLARGSARYVAMTAEQGGRLAEHGRHGSPERAVWADDFGPADLLALSRIADAKFRRLRVAVDLLAAGVMCCAAGCSRG
jgi:hypothetical protein